MALELVAFESFKTHESNAELVALGKYGIHEIAGDTFVTKEISEEDFVKYNLTCDVEWQSDTIMQLNSQYACYPFAILISE